MQLFSHDKPFLLETGAVLPQLEITYYTYGKLNDDGSNVV